jgi:hypothetical protein
LVEDVGDLVLEALAGEQGIVPPDIVTGFGEARGKAGGDVALLLLVGNEDVRHFLAPEAQV